MMLRLFLIFLLIVSAISCKENSSNKFPETDHNYFCDMEELSSKGLKFIDKYHNNIIYENANLRTTERSFSGKYSIKINKENPYGLTIKIPDIKIGDYFKISVWRNSDIKNTGHLVI